MQCDIQRLDDGQAVLQLGGRLDLLSANQFRAVVDGVVADGHRTVIADLSGVTFMDSSGLGALVAGLKTSRQSSGDLRIAGATDQVLEVLELTKLHRVLRPYDSVEAALEGG